MVAVPFFKIFAVLFKEASKPLAAQIKQRAQNHPDARGLAIVIGRKYEAFSQRVEAMFAGVKLRELKTVTDAHALTVGVDLVSQGFLLSVALALVVLEYWRNNKLKEEETRIKRNDKKLRQQIKEERLSAMEDRMHKLEFQLVTLEESISSLRRRAETAQARHPKSNGTKHLEDPTRSQADSQQTMWSYLWGSSQRPEGSHHTVADHGDDTQAALESATKAGIVPLEVVARFIRHHMEAWTVSSIRRLGVRTVRVGSSYNHVRMLAAAPLHPFGSAQPHLTLPATTWKSGARSCVPFVAQLR